MNKIKISEAFLRNCEGFMFEQVLLDKIDTYLKTDHEHGMTLKGLTNVSPRDLTATLGDGNPIFSKTEVSKIINLLAKFDLSLKDMATHCYNSRGERVTDSNLDYEINNIAAPEIESAAEKTWEEVQDFEPKH